MRKIYPLISLCACLTAVGGDLAFKFDNEGDFKAWRIASPKLEDLTPAGDYAMTSKYALRFASPKWAQGMPEWPSCEAKPIVKDWTPYDRLVLDITNPKPEAQHLSMFASDSKVPFRQALSGGITVPGCSCQRLVVKLSGFPASVDRKDISILHLFTQRPEADMELYVGNIMLLRPNEEPPALPKAYVRQFMGLCKDAVASVKAAAEKEITALEALCDHPDLKRRQANAKRQIHLRLSNLEKKLAEEDLSMDEIVQLRTKLDEMPMLFKRLPSEIAFQKACIKAGMDTSKLLVGTASSMVKILPKDMPFEVQVTKQLELSLARNEWESLQIAVMCTDAPVNNVKVSVQGLKDAEGHKLAQVDCDTVGYVKTQKRPPYSVSYVGWWPDPILRGCKNINLNTHELQTFWLRFHAGKEQKAGVYTGKVQVSGDGVKPIVLDLKIKVRDFNVPANTPLPTAITFGYNPKQCSVVNDYDIQKFKYSDFLADYLIDYDHLYRGESPDYDIIKRLHDQGRLTAFNLGNVFNGGVSEKDFEAQIEKVIARLKPAYEKAKELGVLDHAYIYGFDERGADQFPILERCCQALRKAFPEVLLMTTSYDATYGANSVVKTMDAWCPLTPVYERTCDKVPAAREAGKFVWWYICCGPHNPHTNWFVEYAAIESRLLMGAQTYKYRPDGFLYYHTSIWNGNKGIDCEAGAYTTWNPVSWTVYHGDGSLFHCDKNGDPLPSIRLENYRDGQEDYAYGCLLEEAVKRIEGKANRTAKEDAWLTEAKKALEVPEELVKNMHEYSRDPAVLAKWRDNLGDLIEASGIAPTLNPWKGDFGVRGWRK